jgi:hypothetical protein
MDATLSRPNLSRLLAADRTDCRFAAFVLSSLIYAVYGEPTPDRFGWAEIFVGVLLVYAAGIGAALSCLRFQTAGLCLWQNTGKIFLIYGMVVPVSVGIIKANDPLLIVRDVIPFVFIFIPLFFGPLIWKKEVYGAVTCRVLVFIGLMFSLRAIMPALSGSSGGGNWLTFALSDPAYLVNAPTVLFSAILLSGLAGKSIYQAVSFRSFVRSGIFLALAAVPFATMVLLTQRAGLGLIAVSFFFLSCIALVRSPAKAVAPLLLSGGILFIFGDDIQAILHLFAMKTSLVGLNMRMQEAVAVLDLLNSSLRDTLFGTGWGGTLKSPAVAGMDVNFTHSLITTYLLKTGIIGTIFVIVYLAGLANTLFRILFHNPVLAVALAAPFFIDVFLYASFKSLDFGLILLLIAAQQNRLSSMSKGAINAVSNSGGDR